MKTRLRIGLAVIGLLSALVVAHTASADDSEAGSAAPLTGETLITSEIGENPGSSTVSGECDPFGTSTFDFSVTGVAVGPYPGTFTEEGTLSFGPFGLGVGFDPASFDASFVITSSGGTVTGTKTLTGATVPPVFGACGEFAFEDGAAEAIRIEANVSYTATIATPEGTTTDSGEGRVDFGDTQVRGVADFNGFAFTETFASTAGGGGGGGDDDDGGGDDDDD